jgi:hypothetical protein
MKGFQDVMLGAVDMHQHLGPSVIPRRLDILDGAKEAIEAGMKGILVKDHQFPSMASVELVRKAVNNKIFVGSSLVLNHEMGGLNIAAVETAINMGVNMIWMPTISTENHFVSHEKHGLKFPASKKKIDTLKREFIPLINKDGSLTEECHAVLVTIAKDPDVILGAGHGSSDELDVIIREALALGIQKIVVNHPTYMIDASIDRMKGWAEKGVTLEFGACTCDPISTICNMDIDTTVSNMKAIGIQSITLASDYGQVTNPRPVEGLRHFGNLLLEKGFTRDELEIMMKHNPSKLLGI